MKAAYEQLRNHESIVIWGAGDALGRYFDRLDPSLSITAVCDSDSAKWGAWGKLPCIPKDDLTAQNAVLVAIDKLTAVEQIFRELDEKGIPYCHIREAVTAYLPVQEERALRLCHQEKRDAAPDRLTLFFDCAVPLRRCNLRCDYCYVRQHGDFQKYDMPILHTPAFIRKALSKDRLGGVSFFNFCGWGETLLCEGLIPIVKALIDEGHYVQIVTNGTPERGIREILESGMDLSHLFIKFSLHYLELKRRGLLEKFAEHVNRVWDAGASITLEIVPDDGLIPYIPEIMDFSLRHFGALPHCTVPRDETTQSLRVPTELPMDEFRRIWEQFHSPMFGFKMKNVSLKRYEDCKAGLWSFQLDLETGALYQCAYNPYLDNLYEDLSRPFRREAVGNRCCLPYCYNCHAYLVLGVIPEVEAPNYCEMRDRETADGRHWLSGTMRAFFSQKLGDNHPNG